MSISPWTQGDGLPAWTIGLKPDSGPVDIAGLSTGDFTMVFINSAGQEVIGSGPFSNLTVASGSTPATITYQVGSADVATLGVFDARVVIKRGVVGQQRTLKLGSFVVER